VKHFFFSFGAFLLLLAGTAQADVIYSNFPGGSGAQFNSLLGWSVRGAGIGDPFAFAIPIVVPQSTILTQIGLGLVGLDGTPAAQVRLAGDLAGSPGAVLQSWLTTGLENGNSLQPTLLVANTLLVAGQTYWLEVIAGADDSWVHWRRNTTGATTDLWQSFDQGASFEFGTTFVAPAYSLEGTAIPEPGMGSGVALVLLGLSLAARFLC
jgi:hypothetical protein